MLPIRLVSNSQESANHSTRLDKLLDGAKRFDCYVAFANWNGLGYLWDSMAAAVEAGTLSARFVLGLDFFHTEPDTLYYLQELAENNPQHVELYICHRPAHWSQLMIGTMEPPCDRHIGATR